ncbi:MAG: protein kinase [Casimicrobiaceae bacterium]
MSITVSPAPGGDPDESPSPNSLPVGTRVGDFEVVGIVGEGGFSFVYEAFDHTLHRRVALKEYMPNALASRLDGRAVGIRSKRYESTFVAGLKSFVNEARLLAQFDHPALVKVFRFWEQNDTAYMVMPLYEGRTLKDVLREHPNPNEAWLKAVFAPLLDALEILHTVHCYHRDIAPDNILVLDNGSPLLLDFGAARRIIGEQTQAVTVILKPGYAPIEQYADDPALKQGPWTDIYAMSAVLRLAITGKAPATSVTRIVSDPLRPLAETVSGYGKEFLQAIDRGLAVRPEERPQTVAEFRQALGIRTMAPSTQRLLVARPQAPVSPLPMTSDMIAPADTAAVDLTVPVASAPRTFPNTSPARPLTLPPEAPAFALDPALSNRMPPAAPPVAMQKDTGATSSIPPPQAGTTTKRLWWIAGLGGLLAVMVVVGVAYFATRPVTPLPAKGAITANASTPPAAAPSASTPAASTPSAGTPPASTPSVNTPTASAPVFNAPAANPSGTRPVPEQAANPVSAAPALPGATLPKEGAARTANAPVAAQMPAPNVVVPSQGAPAPAPAAPVAPVAPALTGRIVLEIKPWGEVLVDGKTRGFSPPMKTVALPEGKYRIEIRNPAAASIYRDVEIKAGRNVPIAYTFK